MANNKRIFIFGASGFIGKYLKNKFSSDNSIEVLGYSSKTCNLLSLSEIQQALSPVGPDDSVIIASAITRVRENSHESMMKNIQMVENLCQAISGKSVKHITFLSTIDVYGVDIGQDERINETFLLKPNDYYSVSKIISECLLKQTCSKQSIPLAILRLSGIYGPGDNFNSTIGFMVKSALKDKNIIIYNQGDDLRDFVYVDDIYQIIKSAINNKKDVLVNLATGKSFTIKEIVTLIKDFLPSPVEIKHKERESSDGKRVKNLQFDCSVIKKKFSDVNITNLKTGVRDYVKHAMSLGLKGGFDSNE